MKTYTDLEQSRKLAEFLPLESADMTWQQIYDENHIMSDYKIELLPFRFYSGIGIPAWNLAALLELIRNFQPNNQSALFVGKEDGYQYMSSVYLATHEHNNPIDVCYVMILKLHELKLL